MQIRLRGHFSIVRSITQLDDKGTGDCELSYSGDCVCSMVRLEWMVYSEYFGGM
jgi:hypothetical protein